MNEPDVTSPILEMTQGSYIWQIIFLTMAAVFLLTKALGGFMSGGPRQFMGLVALVAAYGAAIYAGPKLAPWLDNYLAAPDLIVIPVGGAVVALVVYLIIVSLGVCAFESARELEPGKKKTFYQVTGFIVGTIYGVAILGVVLIAINFLGTISNASVHAAVRSQIEDAELQAQHRGTNVTTEIRAGGPAQFFARLQNSVRMGPGEEVVSTLDPVPDEVYETVDNALRVMTDPEAVARFGQHPEMRDFLEHPKIVALANDPNIAKMAEERQFVLLLRDPKVIEAANDQELRRALRKSDFRAALEYALGEEPAPNPDQSTQGRGGNSRQGPGTPSRNLDDNERNQYPDNSVFGN